MNLFGYNVIVVHYNALWTRLGKVSLVFVKIIMTTWEPAV